MTVVGRTKGPSPTSGLGRDHGAGLLSEDDARLLREACRTNASELLGEAALLAKNGHQARAYALAAFAAEEATKAVILVSVQAILEFGGQIDWPEFWKNWRNHDPKVQAGILFGSHMPEGLDALVALVLPIFDQGMPDSIKHKAVALRKAREAAIYVDWAQGVRAPSVRVAGSVEMVGHARKLVALAEEFAGILGNAEVMAVWKQSAVAAASGGLEATRDVLTGLKPSG